MATSHATSSYSAHVCSNNADRHFFFMPHMARQQPRPLLSALLPWSFHDGIEVEATASDRPKEAPWCARREDAWRHKWCSKKRYRRRRRRRIVMRLLL